jgi:excinuclease ABC subunit C
VADPSTYRPAPGSIPDAPGVYRFRDDTGRIIYVGKAKSLRSRLNSYFADYHTLHARTQQMVTSASGVDWVVVATEVEALQLEYSWIKEFDPRFNVRYRDDKSYPYLAVTLDEEFPRLQVMRGAKRKGVRYFGPYSHAWAIRETLDLLLRIFPARTCKAGVFRRAQQIGRPCLLGDIGKCSAPCVGRVSPEEHRAIVLEFCDFMAGKTDDMQRRLEKQMYKSAEAQEYELAARLRDDLVALRRAMEKQSIVLGDGASADVVAFADDPLEAAVQVFHVRGGRVRGQRGWIVEKTEDLTLGDLVHHFCRQIYGDEVEEADLPREVLVPALPSDVDALSEWLAQRRGSKVSLRVPQRGDKKTLLETVARNASQALTEHKLKRAGDLTARGRALEEIADALGMANAPLRVECFDISQIQGTDVVASMVVFEDGLPRKSDYRRFIIKGATDDVSAISEVIRRRFHRFQAETADAPALNEDGRPRKFAYSPNLVVVDGGGPQVNAAAEVMTAMGITGVAICGLAKRLEEVWLPDDSLPVIMSRTSEGLYLLQRVRDEAHRFAITFHRQRRSARMTASDLDRVPGVGETRRKALLRQFGSVKRLSAATAEEIAEVPGIGRRTAQAILEALGVTQQQPVSATATPSANGAPSSGPDNDPPTQSSSEPATAATAPMVSETETETGPVPPPKTADAEPAPPAAAGPENEAAQRNGGPDASSAPGWHGAPHEFPTAATG